jgi:Ser/Thr protein kinase RdoA (MazF antagonist)
MKIERACIEKTRTFPDWLTRAIERERDELASITDPVQRRLAEIEIDAIESRVKNELAGAH